MFFKKTKKDKWKKITTQEYNLVKSRKKNILKFKYKKIDSSTTKSIFHIIIFLLKFLIIFILIIIIAKYFSVIYNNNEIELDNREYNISCDKWIVMNSINPPSESIKNLEKNIVNWKIVVLGNIKTSNSKWSMFKNSSNLFYLSLKAQKNLGYNISYYLSDDSNNRKNIGYLFAIQHGAKQIYEIDENLNISMENQDFLNYKIKHSYVCYGVPNDGKMINPYIHFGETNIWPRGFLLKDIINDYNKTFYYAYNTQVKLKPLIYQDVINGIPDVDSLFLLTNGKSKENFNISFSSNFPLLYLPGNYVPINSKNTKFLYEVFPFMMLPITINESISDILRGYIIERFVYGYGGTIVYHNSNTYMRNKVSDNYKLLEENEILFHLNEILEIIKSNNYLGDNPKELLFYILDELIKNNFLKKEEKLAYETFLNDLDKIGYKYTNSFSPNISKNYMDYLNIASELIYYIPINPIILKGYNSFKIFKHTSSDKVYNNILLIINYNMKGLLKSIPYLEELYKKYFPNIVYLYPGTIEGNSTNIIECPESHKGYYSYKCIEKVHQKFTYFKGYLLINDDDYVKIWELENFDFDIPWFYRYEAGGINPIWSFYGKCKKLSKLVNNNLEWKNKFTNFFGMLKIFNGFSDLYYIPNYYIQRFIELLKTMYESKIFLECAVHASFAIISAPKYQVMHIRPLWVKEKERCINVLYKEFQQFSIHPIKFSKDIFKEGVNKYNFFVNANEY